VEECAKSFDGERAGIRPGDVIFAWSRDTEQGEIGSPFDLSNIETEQAPRGNVTLRGLRGGESVSWTMGANSWRIRARPRLPEAILAVFAEARRLAESGKREEAADRWLQTANSAASAESPWLRPWLMLQAATEWANARKWNESDKAFQLAIEQAPGAGKTVEVQIWMARAARFEQRGDLKSAEGVYQNALSVDPADNLTRAGIWNRLGILAAQTGRFDQAAAHYLHALELRQKLAPGSLDVARTLSNLGLLAGDRGDLRKAAEYHSQALEIRERLAPNSLDVATSLANIGLVVAEQGDLEQAEQLQLGALDIRQRIDPDSPSVAESLLSLGKLALDRGDLATAAQDFERALEIRQKLAPDSLLVAESLTDLGNVSLQRGDLVQSEQLHRRALEIQSARAPESVDMAASFTNLGIVAAKRHDLDRAEDFYRKGLAIKQKLAPDSLTVARSLNDLGDLAYHSGNFAKARDYHRQALQIRQARAPGSLEVARSLNSLATVLVELRELSKARSELLVAREIEARVAPTGLDMAETLGLLSEVARGVGAKQRADADARRSLEITQSLVPGSRRHAECLAALAGIVGTAGRLEEAAGLFGQSVDMFELQATRLGGAEEIRAGFRAQFTEHYRSYIDVLVKLQQQERAFQVFERSRARSLLEILAEARVHIRQGVDPDLLGQERSLQQALAALNTRRARALDSGNASEQQEKLDKRTKVLLADFQQVESDIRTRSPSYAALTHPRLLSVRDVQRELLDPQTILLEYSLGDQASYLWEVTKSSFSVYTLPRRSTVETAVHELRLQLSLSDGAALERATAKLGQLVLGPVASQLGKKRLVIVADGALESIPFAILPDPEFWNSGQPAEPLVSRHEIVTLPSASVLAVLRRQSVDRKRPDKSVAIFADPVFDSADPRVTVAEIQKTSATLQPQISHLPRLLFSRREAEAISAVIPAETTMKALDFSASRAAALAPELARYRILHFATHAIADNQHPALSGLVLSLVDRSGKPQNGFLGLGDIYNLELPLDLVVLSACETGLGKEVRGEGLLGLTRGFMYAGAGRVMASMWAVNDAATAALMATFYRGMELQHLTPAAALRQAQIEIWRQKRWKSPYYWGAFQLQGDWN
jgi:CHAT domain-containing protein/Tfp pilus assembly protein PilF